MNWDSVVQKYARRGILIDTNILLLHLVGSVDHQLVPRFKRTSQFNPADYALLEALLLEFRHRVTTPSILTEVSNLSAQLREPARTLCMQLFAEEITLVREEYLPSRELACHELFPILGLTDCGILRATVGQYLVLTDDYQLANRLQAFGADALNFNHLRVTGWN